MIFNQQLREYLLARTEFEAACREATAREVAATYVNGNISDAIETIAETARRNPHEGAALAIRVALWDGVAARVLLRQLEDRSEGE